MEATARTLGRVDPVRMILVSGMALEGLRELELEQCLVEIRRWESSVLNTPSTPEAIAPGIMGSAVVVWRQAAVRRLGVEGGATEMAPGGEGVVGLVH